MRNREDRLATQMQDDSISPPGEGLEERSRTKVNLAHRKDTTDHVWTLREVLLFRVPPWPQPAGL
jgi:hypothetical protein